MYEYIAEVIRCYDGDTITCNIDLGFGVVLSKQSIRLIGIDTPEIRGEEREAGLESKKALEDRILNRKVVLKTYKDKKGKYGRWLAEVFINGESINKWLLENNYAKEYK